MGGLSIGFFSPESEFKGRVNDVCAIIHSIVGPTSIGFPLGVSPVVDEKGDVEISYAVIRGHIPVHIDRRAPNEKTTKIFHFFIRADNRPVLLFNPATHAQAEAVLIPPEGQLPPRLAWGAVEIRRGNAFHFDIAAGFHGITGYPTGEVPAEMPSAVLVQVPWEDPRDIGGAVATMRRVMRRDERFAPIFN